MSYCNNCNREGQLVMQEAMPPGPHAGINRPWVFRYYLCQWHRSSEYRANKRANPNAKKLRVIEWRPDEEVLAELEKAG